MRGIKRGFTLIELMVVIAIMAILVVVAVPSYNEYNNNQKLAEAANQLQTILRQAQNNAQTGTVCKIGSNNYTASSWTITLSSNNYNVKPVCSGAPPTPTPTISSQIDLQNTGITISSVIATSLTDSSPCSVTLPSTIDYKNLSSEVTFTASGCPQGITSPNVLEIITLSLGSKSKIVVVEKGGGIYVNQ